MRMKEYSVTISYSGSRTYSVSAPDYEEAEGIACDEFENDCGEIREDTTIDDVISEEDGNEE
jgi:hypothetical protein